MSELWTVVVTVLAGLFGVGLLLRVWAERRKRAAELAAGAMVFVCTPDNKRLVARILSRGTSHAWIELAPGDARFWVPASALEPLPGFLAERLERERLARVRAREAGAAARRRRPTAT
jgi:hypothetical protein